MDGGAFAHIRFHARIEDVHIGALFASTARPAALRTEGDAERHHIGERQSELQATGGVGQAHQGASDQPARIRVGRIDRYRRLAELFFGLGISSVELVGPLL